MWRGQHYVYWCRMCDIYGGVQRNIPDIASRDVTYDVDKSMINRKRQSDIGTLPNNINTL